MLLNSVRPFQVSSTNSRQLNRKRSKLYQNQIIPTSPYEHPYSRVFINYCKTNEGYMARRLIDKHKYLVYEFDDIGMTGLHWACKRGCADVGIELIKNKALLNAEDILQRTPLYFAIKSNSVKLVQALVSQGCNLWCKDSRYDYKELAANLPEILQIIKENRQMMFFVRLLRNTNTQNKTLPLLSKSGHHGPLDDAEITRSAKDLMNSHLNQTLGAEDL